MNYKEEVLKRYPDAECVSIDHPFADEYNQRYSDTAFYRVQCGEMTASDIDKGTAWFKFYNKYCKQQTTMNKNLKAGLITVGFITSLTVLGYVFDYFKDRYPDATLVALLGIIAMGTGYIFQSIKSKL